MSETAEKYGQSLEPLDWTLTFDQFINKLCERKEKRMKHIMERSEGEFNAAEDFNGCSIWALYDAIDTYRRALRDACEEINPHDNRGNCFEFYVSKNRKGGDPNGRTSEVNAAS